MYSLLEKLMRKYELILITTCSKNRRKKIKELELIEIFKKIVICTSKSQKIFKQIAQEAKEITIIGDNETEEVYIGKQLGIPVIKANPKIENPTETIKNSILIKT